MEVKDLIKQLQQYSDDTEVVMLAYDDEDICFKKKMLFKEVQVYDYDENEVYNIKKKGWEVDRCVREGKEIIKAILLE